MRALLVIGAGNSEGDRIETSLVNTVRFVRCTSSDGLLREVARTRGQVGLLDRLDIVDHGEPGIARLGRSVLFASASSGSGMVGLGVARALVNHLDAGASIRLIHCSTGEGPLGRNLLLQLAHVFGPRRLVFAGIGHITANKNFNEFGFAERTACPYLFSSEEAKRGCAIVGSARVVNCKERISRQRPVPFQLGT